MKNLFYITFILVLIFQSCGGGSDYNLWPDATGKPSELLLVIDDNKWKSPVGDSLKTFFREGVFGLPQPEPMFDLIHVKNKAFSKLFQTHRNIIRVKISPQNKENSVKMKRNPWARPQVYFEIKAQNDSAFLSLFEQYKYNMRDSLMLADRNNYTRGFRKFKSEEVSRILHSKGIDLAIPKGFRLNEHRKTFLWFSHETTVLNQGLLVMFLDYKDTAQFQQKNLIHQIDSVLKVNVPGENNSYMQLEKVIGAQYSKYMTNNNFTVKLRGLWETEGFAMGGPYVATAIPEVQRNRITILLGFVYAPKLHKRNYMRQLEAIISTIRFVAIDETAMINK